MVKLVNNEVELKNTNNFNISNWTNKKPKPIEEIQLTLLQKPNDQPLQTGRNEVQKHIGKKNIKRVGESSPTQIQNHGFHSVVSSHTAP